ncbi:phosphomannomutase [Aliirhizobium terrae]|uniref:phosphomannomutase n=1 Tax=Terrirhizobium terrae TaxID=2926709 RepID=UPI0025784304|nr:phosphomannomutase [Rhizobium sp. CC-CFT758]WJH39655.1 phosphomannomutase [Rhizobium sp. CC-CFT758]
MKFGTSGLRGLVTDLEGEASALYAQAFAQHLMQMGHAASGDTILVGRDFRPSSPSISATCIGALLRAGLVPVDCGTVPTPALALYGFRTGAASLMITGSHIPADRNGIKFYRADGEIDKNDELRIAAIASELASKRIDDTPAEAANAQQAVTELFMSRVTSILPPDALKGLKIGVYEHSTVARELLSRAIEGYGADIVKLGFSDQFIPVDTEAVSQETVAQLRIWARDHELDAIVSADGDGDRPLLADEAGAPLRGDLLGLLTARFLGARVVVTPVTSNSGLEKSGSFDVIRTRVGSPFVIAGMLEALSQGRSKVIGFEANGGLLTGSPFGTAAGELAPLPTRDSFMPILAALWTAARDNKPLSALSSDFNLACAMADRLENFPVETGIALMNHLRNERGNLETFVRPLGKIQDTSDIDGLRITFDDGRVVHLRPSGNAPEMRCYVEAETDEAAAQLLHDSLDLIRELADSVTKKPDQRVRAGDIS